MLGVKTIAVPKRQQEQVLTEWAQAIALLGTWNNPRTRNIFTHGKNFKDGVTNHRQMTASTDFRFSLHPGFVFYPACADPILGHSATYIPYLSRLPL